MGGLYLKFKGRGIYKDIVSHGVVFVKDKPAYINGLNCCDAQSHNGGVQSMQLARAEVGGVGGIVLYCYRRGGANQIWLNAKVCQDN